MPEREYYLPASIFWNFNDASDDERLARLTSGQHRNQVGTGPADRDLGTGTDTPAPRMAGGRSVGRCEHEASPRRDTRREVRHEVLTQHR